MVAWSLESPSFYVGFAEGNIIEGREAVGALVPVMVLPAEETVIEDSIVLVTDPELILY